jgi:hypothetical protein
MIAYSSPRAKHLASMIKSTESGFKKDGYDSDGEFFYIFLKPF